VTLHRIFAFAHTALMTPMSTRLPIGIAAIAGASLCGLISTLVNDKMVNQVNGKLPKEMQFSSFGWYLSKTLRLHREYRRLFPDGELLLQARLLMAVGFGGLLVGVWALGFFER
jgi:hypothetical protein